MGNIARINEKINEESVCCFILLCLNFLPKYLSRKEVLKEWERFSILSCVKITCFII